MILSVIKHESGVINIVNEHGAIVMNDYVSDLPKNESLAFANKMVKLWNESITK